jgi:hypothetical protein
MEQELKENPCIVCLVRAICFDICSELRYFGNYLRRKNNGVPLGHIKWMSEYEVRSRIIESYPIKYSDGELKHEKKTTTKTY